MISFIQGSKFREISSNQDVIQHKKHNGKLLYLLDPSNNFNILELIPKTFIISSFNWSSKFNIKLIKNSSPIIRETLKQNPQCRQYQLNFQDPFNVLRKFEELFQGKFVFFSKEELPYVKKLTDLIQISRCPKYMKYSLDGNENDTNQELYLVNGVVINPNYDFFLANKVSKSFTIITNKNEYKCNIYGILASNLIRDLLKYQPNLKQYKYDFDDECDEFQEICDIFNFQKITITPDNMNVLKEISEHFRIDHILTSINKFIQKQNDISQTIEDGQNSVELIDQLFEWLYNIKELTVETVKSSILDSVWTKSDDDVRELAAFLLQVIKHDISLHNEMIELVTSLGEKLTLLTPFLVGQLMNSFGSTINNCSFVYKLYKKGVISKDKLQKKLSQNAKNNQLDSFKNIISWFLPELIEFNLFKESKIQDPTNYVFNYIRSFLPDKIEMYKAMRDSEEPDDLITKVIRIDDVDTLQSIIANTYQLKNVSKCYIPYNIFDFFNDEKVSYLNYSAACGSIKCFKYLLLNHEEVNQNTFRYAAFSGNIEIIKIVDQQISNNKRNYNNNNLASNIVRLITNHRNDLFDWVFEQKFDKDDLDIPLISNLINVSIENGNIHALIEFIDNGYNLHSNSNIINLLKLAAENGFYRLLEILISIAYKKPDIIQTCQNRFDEFIKFDNLQIYKLFLDTFKPDNNTINEVICCAIVSKRTNILDYFFNEQIKNGYIIDSKLMRSFINLALTRKSDDIFQYLIENFKKFNKVEFNKINWGIQFLETASLHNNEKGFKTVIELHLKSSKDSDFSKCFINSLLSNSKEICKHLIDKKLFTDFELFLTKSKELAKANLEIISMILECCDSQLKESLLQLLFYPAIENHNFELVEYLLKENILQEDSLINAVSGNDYEIFELIIKYKNDSYFINQSSYGGTPLIIAVKNNNYLIVKKLLSLPSINPNSLDSDNKTALIRAAEKLNFEIIYEFLSFYNEKIFDNRNQLDCFLSTLSNRNRSYEQINKVFERLISYDKFIEILDENNYNFIIELCSNGNFASTVKLLLKNEKINFNIQSFLTGNTPLIAAIKKNNVEIAELLIKDPRTNINLKNFDKQSALTVAILAQLDTIIELLLNNKKLDPKESLLNYAFIISNATISQILLSKNFVDVNCKFYDNQNYNNNYYYNNGSRQKVLKTALLQAVKVNDTVKLEIIINHPKFDKYKSLVNESIELAISTKNNECLRKLLELLSIKELNEFKCNGKSLILLMVENQNVEILEELLQNKDFLISNEDIINCVYNLFKINNKSYQLLKILFDYDAQHNKSIDFNLRAFLTWFRQDPYNLNSDILIEQYRNIINYLDMKTNDNHYFNVPNEKFVYPFEHAIQINSLEYATALINTRKLILDFVYIEI